MNYRNAFYFVCLVLFVSACTITKRQYNNGYHFEWRNHYSSSNEKTDPIKVDLSKSDEIFNSEKIAQTEEQSNVEREIENHSIDQSSQNETAPNQWFKLHQIKSATKLQKIKDKVSFVKKSTDFVKKKKQAQIGEIGIRTPREYLIAALACLVGGIVLVGIAVLLIVVLEVEGLSIGGLLAYLMVIVGFGCLIAVPVCLLLALLTYLFF
ncbi:MAG: hypothetical protein RI922_1979 [Bacteroidota bacterium]|jgi:preprotein translocase subunit SecF